MAGTLIINDKKAWTIGIHAFGPIIDMVRDLCKREYPQDEDLSSVFEPMDQGFDMVSIGGLSSLAFRRFASCCKRLPDEIRADPEIEESWKGRLEECVQDLIAELSSDPRW